MSTDFRRRSDRNVSDLLLAYGITTVEEARELRESRKISLPEYRALEEHFEEEKVDSQASPQNRVEISKTRSSGSGSQHGGIDAKASQTPVVVNVHQAAATPPPPVIIRRCAHCGTVYPESSLKCPSCGARF
jgi:rRNA maturation endonuclease Nob1